MDVVDLESFLAAVRFGPVMVDALGNGDLVDVLTVEESPGGGVVIVLDDELAQRVRRLEEFVEQIDSRELSTLKDIRAEAAALAE
jgi:hypothetical protein